MFINASSREINLRVVLFGPDLAQNEQTLRYLYEHLPSDAKGRLIAAERERERTLFFDFLPPRLGAIRGYSLRLHVYTLAGEVRLEATPKQILRGVDGVAFLADRRPERAEANMLWQDILQDALREQGRSLEGLPWVQLSDVDPESGRGVFDGIKALTKALLLALSEGRLLEHRSTPEEQQEAEDFISRSRIVGHLGARFGETLAEYGPGPFAAGRRKIIVVEHGPEEATPWWTYATAGLCLAPQPAGGPEPRLELLAYAHQRDPRIAAVLMALAYQIASAAPEDPPYKTFDTVDLAGLPLLHTRFRLAPAMEPAGWLAFPSAEPVDLWLRTAVGPGPLRFLHVLPVSAAELAEANTIGTPQVLQRLGLEGDRARGWPST